MKQYPENEEVQTYGCYVMHWMVSTKSSIETINTHRGELIENAMKQYPNNSEIQEHGKEALDRL